MQIQYSDSRNRDIDTGQFSDRFRIAASGQFFQVLAGDTVNCRKPLWVIIEIGLQGELFAASLFELLAVFNTNLKQGFQTVGNK